MFLRSKASFEMLNIRKMGIGLIVDNFSSQSNMDFGFSQSKKARIEIKESTQAAFHAIFLK